MTSIGIPRGLMLFYQQFPFWRAFFESLDFNVVLSRESNKKILTNSIELMTCETCLPVELMHGQVDDLLKKGVDHIFLPFIVNVDGEKDNPTNNCNCPWIQSHPFMIKAAFNDHPDKDKLLIPTFHLRYFNTAFKDEITSFMKETFGISKQKVLKAVKMALEAQDSFDKAIEERGKEVLANLPEDKKAFVIIGRPYNTGDTMLNLNLVDKLIGSNVLPVPLDFLPLKEENVFEDFPMMYWPNGQKILAAMKIINKYDNLHALYLSNFRCGPDSFILHFIKQEKNLKPFLHLEIDEHSANAGVITRIEAFLDSLEGYEKRKKDEKKALSSQNGNGLSNQRVLYFPYARDTVHVLSAACRYCNIPSEVLPMQDETDIELGRKHTNGNECFPFVATTGSFLKKILHPDSEPEKLSFFMPDHNGPCRFGEYNKLQRIIFDNLGYQDVDIVHPSNEDSYASIAPGQSVKWRKASWKGILAVDLIRKMLQQIRPYEIHKGDADKVYQEALKAIIQSVEKEGGDGLPGILKKYAHAFRSIPYHKTHRKPVVAVVGEIFMRDNPFCSGFLVERLEKLGAETLMAPFGEWVYYSTYRFKRDSKWKRNMKGIAKSQLQYQFQKYYEHQYTRIVEKIFPIEKEIRVEEMLEHCNAYIHKDYDGDPPLAIGTASILSDQFVSGIVNILPFTCMPGTLNSAVSNVFRKDYDGIPWENFAYDGQDDTNIDTRLQAFMYQAREFAKRKEFDKQLVEF